MKTRSATKKEVELSQARSGVLPVTLLTVNKRKTRSTTVKEAELSQSQPEVLHDSVMVTQRKTRSVTRKEAQLFQPQMPLPNDVDAVINPSKRRRIVLKEAFRAALSHASTSTKKAKVKAAVKAEVKAEAKTEVKAEVKSNTKDLPRLMPGISPYPDHQAPKPEDCEEVHRILMELHGEYIMPEGATIPSLKVAGCGNVPSVLDALLRTIISGNVTMDMANTVIQRLVAKFGVLEAGIGAGSINWENVRVSPLKDLEEAISIGGCHALKGGYIKAILDQVHGENLARYRVSLEEKKTETGEDTALRKMKDGSMTLRRSVRQHTKITKHVDHFLSLDHCYSMTKDDAMIELVRFKGVGVKTAACVILFCLRKPCFAVDTHVHRFCQWLGWVPPKADPIRTFHHGEVRVPDHLKYGLHQLFIRHGQDCYKCRAATRPGSKEWEEALDCPLEDLLNRGKEPVKTRE